MARTSSGDTAQKRRALEHAAWMNKPPNPLPLFIKGASVQVYRGAGWSAGNVLESTASSCVVKLKQTREDIRVYDARCIRTAN